MRFVFLRRDEQRDPVRGEGCENAEKDGGEAKDPERFGLRGGGEERGDPDRQRRFFETRDAVEGRHEPVVIAHRLANGEEVEELHHVDGIARAEVDEVERCGEEENEAEGGAGPERGDAGVGTRAERGEFGRDRRAAAFGHGFFFPKNAMKEEIAGT